MTDNLVNEITELSNIKKLYQSEFEYHLRKRNMKAKLKEHESAVNDSCLVRLEIARCNTTPDYQMEEVQNALKEIKLGKSVDPAGLIGEVFIRGESGLVNSITAMFNAFKKTLILLGSGMRCLSQHCSKRKVLGRDWIIIEGYLL